MITSQDRLFVLTGAGISADSGLRTFRDAGGLWRGRRPEEVATPEAFALDPAAVWAFYSERRREASDKRPNDAHRALVRLQEAWGDRVYLCTQNVDDLHEKAGARDVHHMHGRLFESRCADYACPSPPFDDRSSYDGGAPLPRCEACGSILRPNVCWFGEAPFGLDAIASALEDASAVLVVGTSGLVYPAAAFVSIARSAGARTLYAGLEPPANAAAFDEVRTGPARVVLPALVGEWLRHPGS